VGTYIGDGTGARKIVTGFAPDIVFVKSSLITYSANFHTTSMADNTAQLFTASAEDTTGNYFTTFDSTGFNVGSSNNDVASPVYNYIAFKNTAGTIKAGIYSGNGVNNRSITDPGFKPNFVIVKGTEATIPVFTIDEHYGDMSGCITDAARAPNMLQKLETNGFNIGTSTAVNSVGTNNYHYFAVKGKTAVSSSGTFKMATGSYTGNGGIQHINISGLSFAPDLVIVKGDTAQQGVFRTSLMGGDSTAYFANGAINFTGGIINLNNNGFTIGISAVTNTNGAKYY
jgi:hypothetical protein